MSTSFVALRYAVRPQLEAWVPRDERARVAEERAAELEKRLAPLEGKPPR